jgi:hypothetical protein
LIAGIGTYRAGDVPPSVIRVATDVIDKYVMKVEPTLQVTDDSRELAPGELRVITCDPETGPSYTSGLAWHTLGGEQFRLLFPDDGGLDATGRTLDLDCDGRAVTPDSSHQDCDDTRRRYHAGASDVCDGEDTNCDGGRTFATACMAALDCVDPFAIGGANGISLCDDATGHATACQPTESCRCADGNVGGCHYCLVPYEPSVATPGSQSMVHPCQPADGVIQTACTAAKPCDVEIVGVRNGWKAKISASSANAFGQRAYGVGSQLAIRVERTAGVADEIPGTPYALVGDVQLAFTTPIATVYYGLELKLGQDNSSSCPVAPDVPKLTCY